MSQLTEVSAQLLQGMLASKYVSDYIKDGRDHTNSDTSKYDAISIESVKYAKSIIRISNEAR